MKKQLLKKLMISAFVIFGFTNVNAQLFDFTNDINNFIPTGAASTDLSSGTTLLMNVQDNRGNTYITQETVANNGYAVDADTYKALRVVVKNNTSLERLSLRLAAGNATVGSFQTITTGDTTFKTYIFDLSSAGNWNGTIESWRIFLGFGDTGVGNAETLEFDSVEFLTAPPAVAEPVITILNVQQIGNDPVDVNQTATFEITYKTDGSGPDITGNTWQLRQGGGVSGFLPVTYPQTNGANATTQISFTWPAGYSSGNFELRLFNPNPKTDFDWAPLGDHTVTILNAGSFEPTGGFLAAQVNVNVVPPVIPFSEYVTNPDFEDPSGLAHYTGSTSEMSRSISSAVAQNGSNSMELSFSQDASKINWLFTTANGQGVYDPDFAAGKRLNISMWVQKTTNYDRSVEITLRTRHYLDGTAVGNSPTASATTTPNLPVGQWEQLFFTIDYDQAFDEVNLWIAVDWEDTDPNGTNALNGDIIYIDNIVAAPIVDTPVTGVEDINKDDASVRLFPNPVNDILNIQAKGRNVSKIEVYSILGRKVLEVENTNTVNVSTLSRGVYISKIFGDDSSVSTKRFVKE